MAGSDARVVHVDHAEYDVYIGRSVLSWGLHASKFANPFRLPRKHTLEDRLRVIEQYRAYLLDSPALLRLLPELRGKVLGCWCRYPGTTPKQTPCHGDVPVDLLGRYSDEELRAPGLVRLQEALRADAATAGKKRAYEGGMDG
jgi:hypothetical protein